MTTPELLPVFAYGTLCPGGSNQHWFGGKDSVSVPAWLDDAVLVSNGRYPYLLDEVEDAAGQRVLGNLVFIEPEDWEEVSASLDELEDTDPLAPVDDGNLYNRVVRTAKTTEGEYEAWVYIPPKAHQTELRASYPLIDSGDWLNQH